MASNASNALAYFATVKHYQGEVVYHIDPWLTGELDYLYVILKIGLDFMLEIFLRPSAATAKLFYSCNLKYRSGLGCVFVSHFHPSLIF
jgi:hypothetical protein